MKKTKRFLSVLLAAIMFFSLLIFASAAFLRGDVSGDGEITAEDARLCLRQAVGLETYEAGSDEFAACDVTGDGEVTAEDARLILRAAVGLEKIEQPENPEDPTDPEDPVLTPDYTENNEYDIFRSGTFYLTGEMTDNGTSYPLEVAKGNDLLYMLSEVNGQKIAMQLIGNDVYLIHIGKNAYFKMDKYTMELIGLDPNELTSDVSMGDMPALSKANKVQEGLLDDKQPCRIYTFSTADGGCTQVYMNGDRFLGLDSYTAKWVRTESMRITSITKDLPEKVTAPGGGGRRVLLFTTFMGYFI